MMRRFSSRSRCSSESSAGNKSRAARSPDAPSTTSVGWLLTARQATWAAHVAREVADQLRVEDPLGELPAFVGACEAIAILAGEDRVQPLAGDLQHREVGAGASGVAVDLDRHVRELMHRLRRAVVVEDHRVVQRARFGRAAKHPVVAREAQLGVREQLGDAVEVARIETERVLVDQRGDLRRCRSLAREGRWACASIRAHCRS